MNPEGFFSYKEKLPSVGDSVIIAHDGQEKKAKYVEYMNGSAFGFLVYDEFIPYAPFWKPFS